jgi:hypothetical protein
MSQPEKTNVPTPAADRPVTDDPPKDPYADLGAALAAVDNDLDAMATIWDKFDAAGAYEDDDPRNWYCLWRASPLDNPTTADATASAVADADW